MLPALVFFRCNMYVEVVVRDVNINGSWRLNGLNKFIVLLIEELSVVFVILGRVNTFLSAIKQPVKEPGQQNKYNKAKHLIKIQH